VKGGEAVYTDHPVGIVTARRRHKRKNQGRPHPCFLPVLYTDHRQVILRAVDVSGKPSLVAVLTTDQARQLSEFLALAASRCRT